MKQSRREEILDAGDAFNLITKARAVQFENRKLERLRREHPIRGEALPVESVNHQRHGRRPTLIRRRRPTADPKVLVIIPILIANAIVNVDPNGALNPRHCIVTKSSVINNETPQ